MSAFVYAAKLHGETAEGLRHRVGKSLDALSRKSLAVEGVIDRPSFSVVVYRRPNSRAKHILWCDNGDFGVAVGTLIYRKRLGIDGLKLLHNDFRADKDVFSHLIGSYTILLAYGNRLLCFNDFNGTYHIFTDLDTRIVSTSMIAALGSISHPQVSKQALYEYLLDGATYGLETPIREVRRLSHASIHQLQPQLESFPKLIAQKEMPRSFKEQVHTISSDLLEYFEILGTHFVNKTIIALSGGYDSRLLLAAAMRAGVGPRAFVGGDAESPDVRAALALAAAEGIPIIHQDPTLHPKVSIDSFPQLVEQQFHYHDGLGIRGAVSDGAEYEFRHQRLPDDMLELNGGGGEHFRDFWQLWRYPISVRDFIRKALVFKSLDTQAALTQEFRREQYVELLAEKIRIAIPMLNDWLPEQQGAALYTLFRTTYFAGPSNKEMNLIGYSLLPFAEPGLTLKSYRMPLSYKRYGRFEAEMIKRLYPQLAGYPSSYGYNLHDGPSIIRRRKADLMRWARESFPLSAAFIAYKSFKPQRRKKKSPYYHAKEYVDRIVDLGNLRIVEYIDLGKIQRLGDPDVLSRALTLELLLRRLATIVGLLSILGSSSGSGCQLGG